MAPNWPEEVDVFSVPHSRMKKLVNKYSNMITATDFRDEFHLTTLLQNLMNVFTEFKAHEQIENILIMKKLKIKLRAASVTSAAVCNCHNDNRLTDMLDLVEDGYRWAHKTEQERQMYGKTLRNALEIFTQNFIPHMEEEEEVFQPMLMQYFSYEELKELKAKVIHQHDISKQHEEYHHEKFVEDLFVSDDCSEQLADTECYFSKLPMETCLQIFSLLGPRELARVGQVSQRFLHLSRDPLLWSRLHPVHWAMGNWSFTPESVGGVDGVGLPSVVDDEDQQETYHCVDEDADIDESGDSDETDNLGAEGLKQILKEARILTAIVKYLLPQVGSGVKVCDLAFSKGLSSSLAHKILKLCPNLEVLDLTHTSVGDIAFRELGVSSRQSKLRHLDFTGCDNITDMTLISLAAMGKKSLSLSSLTERDVEIENVPQSCTRKLRVCCGRSTACGSYHSDGHECDSSVCKVSASKDCEHTWVEACSDISSTSNGIIQSKDNVTVLQLVNGRSDDSSVCLKKGDSQTWDLNFMYVNLLLESGETFSPSHMNSFKGAVSSLAVNPQLNCDNDFIADLPKGSSSSQRTCSAGGILGAFRENQCCKSLKIAAAETFVPCVINCVDKICTSAACTDENHKGSQNSNSPTFDTDGSICSLEFLSLNGCYRISDIGLCLNKFQWKELKFEYSGMKLKVPRSSCSAIDVLPVLFALAEGGGTPQLHHLDLSGCIAVTAVGLSKLVSTSQRLDHSNLYYCDNMTDDPFFTTASGCRNRQCETRFCCSIRE